MREPGTERSRAIRVAIEGNNRNPSDPDAAKGNYLATGFAGWEGDLSLTQLVESADRSFDEREIPARRKWKITVTDTRRINEAAILA